MLAESEVFAIQLKYANPAFPQHEWHAFLKNCNVQRYTSRKGSIWHSIRGKGFIIWISEFSLSRESEDIIWYSEVELSSNALEIAIQTLKEFIAGALSKFEKMEAIGCQSWFELGKSQVAQ